MEQEGLSECCIGSEDGVSVLSGSICAFFIFLRDCVWMEDPKVGIEMDDRRRVVWVYFSLDFPLSLEGVSINTSSILFRHFILSIIQKKAP